MPEPCLGGPYAHSSFMAGWTDSLPSSDLTTEYLTQMQHHHAALTCAPKALRARAPPCHHEQESLPPATINVGVLGLSVWGMQPLGLQGARCTWRLAAALAAGCRICVEQCIGQLDGRTCPWLRECTSSPRGLDGSTVSGRADECSPVSGLRLGEMGLKQ